MVLISEGSSATDEVAMTAPASDFAGREGEGTGSEGVWCGIAAMLDRDPDASGETALDLSLLWVGSTKAGVWWMSLLGFGRLDVLLSLELTTKVVCRFDGFGGFVECEVPISRSSLAFDTSV